MIQFGCYLHNTMMEINEIYYLVIGFFFKDFFSTSSLVHRFLI